MSNVIENSGEVLWLPSPKEKALSKIEHLLNVFEGSEEKFYAYFVLELDEHLQMHDCFLAELGLPEAGLSEFAANPATSVVLICEGVALVRSSNCYDNGQPYDVTYQATRNLPAVAELAMAN